MSWLCCQQTTSVIHEYTYPEPVKFKILRNLNLLNPLISLFILPKKKDIYKFNRQRLFFLQYQDLAQIPCVYFPTKNSNNQFLLIYCHGSGCNLNNVYNFGGNLMVKYGISVLIYDYTGEGQSQKQFHNYQIDIKVVLTWAVLKGYKLQKIILCGFSIGSYSALLIPGPMARILISPVCGVIPFIEGTSCQYQGQIFDNIKNSQKIKAKAFILHGSKQLVPYSHAEAIYQSLRVKNKSQDIDLIKIQGCTHNQMPNVLLKKQVLPYIANFFQKIKNNFEQKNSDIDLIKIKQQIKKIALKLRQCKTLKKNK